MTRTRIIDIHIGWLTIVAALIGITGILIWAWSANPPLPDHPPASPTTTTHTTTTPMPEDLDRP